jgi:hypothetical protein
MDAAVAQEAFMKWDQIQVSWNQLKDKYVREWFKTNGDSGKGLDLIGAEIPSGGQSGARPTAFHADDREKRAEFSLHIGC